MSKAVLISIQPKGCELIANGEETIEVRKTKPKLHTPFKCYIYCTKGMTIWTGNVEDYGTLSTIGNGKVIGEFVCMNIECFTTDYRQDKEQTARIISQSCVNFADLAEYENNAPCLYAWHISDLKIYDKPKELTEFYYSQESFCEKGLCGGCPYDAIAGLDGDYGYDCEWKRPLTRSPQSWCYVEELVW